MWPINRSETVSKLLETYKVDSDAVLTPVSSLNSARPSVIHETPRYVPIPRDDGTYGVSPKMRLWWHSRPYSALAALAPFKLNRIVGAFVSEDAQALQRMSDRELRQSWSHRQSLERSIIAAKERNAWIESGDRDSPNWNQLIN